MKSEEVEGLSAGIAWLIGIDTPHGIHCCNGSCSSNMLVLSCNCEENRKVREGVKEYISKHRIKSYAELLSFAIDNLENAVRKGYDVRELIGIIQEVDHSANSI